VRGRAGSLRCPSFIWYGFPGHKNQRRRRRGERLPPFRDQLRHQEPRERPTGSRPACFGDEMRVRRDVHDEQGEGRAGEGFPKPPAQREPARGDRELRQRQRLHRPTRHPGRDGDVRGGGERPEPETHGNRRMLHGRDRPAHADGADHSEHPEARGGARREKGQRFRTGDHHQRHA